MNRYGTFYYLLTSQIEWLESINDYEWNNYAWHAMAYYFAYPNR